MEAYRSAQIIEPATEPPGQMIMSRSLASTLSGEIKRTRYAANAKAAFGLKSEVIRRSGFISLIVRLPVTTCSVLTIGNVVQVVSHRLFMLIRNGITKSLLLLRTLSHLLEVLKVTIPLRPNFSVKRVATPASLLHAPYLQR